MSRSISCSEHAHLPGSAAQAVDRLLESQANLHRVWRLSSAILRDLPHPVDQSQQKKPQDYYYPGTLWHFPFQINPFDMWLGFFPLWSIS